MRFRDTPLCLVQVFWEARSMEDGLSPCTMGTCSAGRRTGSGRAVGRSVEVEGTVADCGGRGGGFQPGATALRTLSGIATSIAARLSS